MPREMSTPRVPPDQTNAMRFKTSSGERWRVASRAGVKSLAPRFPSDLADQGGDLGEIDQNLMLARGLSFYNLPLAKLSASTVTTG
jgi:hypothetical protein